MKTATIPSGGTLPPNTTTFHNQTTVVPGQAPSPVQTQKFRNKSTYLPSTQALAPNTTTFRNKTVVVPVSAPAPDAVKTAPKAKAAIPVYK